MRTLRLLPQRVAGQIAVLVVAAILVTHAVVSAAFLFLNTMPPPSLETLPGAAAYRLATLVRVVAATPPADRARVVASIRGADVTSSLILLPQPPSRATAGGREHPLMFDLRRYLADVADTVQTGGSLSESPDSAVAVAITLRDGTVLHADLSAAAPRSPPLARIILPTLVFLALTMVLLSLWAARALAAPLDQLAAAADRFGTAQDLAPLPERGPDEVLKVARALDRMRQRVQKLLDDRTGMLAAVSHDLRTPITRLRLRAEFLDPETRRVVLRDLDQMNAMVEGALSFVRDGASGGEAAIRVDVATLAHTVCDLFADTGAPVSYEGPARVVAFARPDDLARALSNLVDNAVKYGKRAILSVADEGDGVAFVVSDAGPGIPEHELGAMLEPFVRGDLSRNLDNVGGFGLGLSIARQIAVAHGGDLTLGNADAGGLVARLAIPKHQGTRAPRVPAPRSCVAVELGPVDV